MDLLSDLTPAQVEAVRHVEGPLLVLAGAGSGKTRVITRRVAYLMSQGIPAAEILAITFTNKAADEMRGRIAALVTARHLTAATFHSFCARVLRTHGEMLGLNPQFAIYTQADSKRALKLALERLNLDAAHWAPEKMQSRISQLKNKMVSAGKYASEAVDYAAKTVAKIYTAYEEILRGNNALDFDDLLLRVATALGTTAEFREALQERYRYILIDEYQDTNEAQYRITRQIADKFRNICATGDPDQSIYGWRGADIRNILDFEKDFVGCKVIRLERNYRSTPQILDVAGELIKHNMKRKQKALFTENPPGARVRVVETDSAEAEARFIAEELRHDHPDNKGLSGVAIFYRVNSLSRALEDGLRAAGVPYEIVRGTSFYERQEIRTLIGYLRVLATPEDDGAVERIINAPTRGIGDTTVARLKEFAAGRTLNLLEACRLAGEVEGLVGRGAGAVELFVKLMDDLAALDRAEIRPLLEAIIAQTRYKDYCRKLGDDDEERQANVDELINLAAEFDEAEALEGPTEEAEVLPPIQRFLERVALSSDQDDLNETSERVHLMTLHAAKGLEFPTVYLVAVEDGLLPHQMAREENNRDIEEERRLCFVGLTRARERLTLSYARYRMHQGETLRQGPSPFLREIGERSVERTSLASETSGAAYGRREYGRGGFGGGGGFGGAATRRWPKPAAETKPERTGDREFEPDEEELARERAALGARSAYRIGQVVSHPTYGQGTIIDSSGEGERARVRVRFQNIGEKVLAPHLAKLKILGGR